LQSDIVRGYLEVDHQLLQTQINEELRVKEKVKVPQVGILQQQNLKNSDRTNDCCHCFQRFSMEGSLVAQVMATGGLGGEFERGDRQMRCRFECGL